MASNSAGRRTLTATREPDGRDGAVRARAAAPAPGSATAAHGCEWLVEARGCDPHALTDRPTLEALFRRMIEELDLNEVEPAVWHVFPGAGGITGMSLLAESHLTCHTFPEHGTLCLNLFCCRPRPEWDFGARLGEMVGARRVDVRRLARRYGPDTDPTARDATDRDARRDRRPDTP